MTPDMATVTEMETAATASSRALLLVELGTALLGFDVGSVNEIVEAGKPSLLPASPRHVLGLLNWRSRPVPVVCLATCLGLDSRAVLDAEDRVVIVHADRMTVALSSGQICGIRDVGSAAVLTDVEAEVGMKAFVQEVLALDQRPCFVVSVPRLLDITRVRS